jgi:peptidoglycan-N-acetylglucosamine deacetylase
VIVPILLTLGVIILSAVCFCIFFDQAVLTRKGTIYRVRTKQKKVVLTFDDGPSPVWTPEILDELKKENIPATFFMIGHHVQKYPEIAKRVADEGHIIGNHGYAHSVLLYYTPAEIEEEIKYTEHVIKEITGQSTKYFRPPKAWLRKIIKEKIKSMGYEIILWSLNSKDWVSFNHKAIVKYLSRNIQNGDILLFHDSGNVSTTEGGDRTQTVRSIPLLAKSVREKGFEFVTIEELVHG